MSLNSFKTVAITAIVLFLCSATPGISAEQQTSLSPAGQPVAGELPSQPITSEDDGTPAADGTSETTEVESLVKADDQPVTVSSIAGECIYDCFVSRADCMAECNGDTGCKSYCTRAFRQCKLLCQSF